MQSVTFDLRKSQKGSERMSNGGWKEQVRLRDTEALNVDPVPRQRGGVRPTCAQGKKWLKCWFMFLDDRKLYCILSLGTLEYLCHKGHIKVKSHVNWFYNCWLPKHFFFIFILTGHTIPSAETTMGVCCATFNRMMEIILHWPATKEPDREPVVRQPSTKNHPWLIMICTSRLVKETAARRRKIHPESLSETVR